jgi:hypothetical protein
MITDPSKLIFSTRFNFQKIVYDDEVTISIPSSITPTVFTLFVHGLGYIPTARVFYTPVSGQLWPLSPNQYQSTGGGSGTTLNIYGNLRLTTNELQARLVNSSGSSQNVTFKYRIYVDE